MSNESIVPPDIQEQLAKQRARATPPSGIGSAAPENLARQPSRHEDPVVEKPPEGEEKPDSICKGAFCEAKLPDDAYFCSRCGFDQMRDGIMKKLGIDPFTEEDVQDYIFRGYVIREIRVLGKHMITLRSSQAKDLKEIDSFIMNGDWTKTENGKEKQVSEFFLRQMNAMSLTAMSIQKVDEKSIGTTLVERVKWLEERGSAFVDLLAQKVQLFNQALTEHLKKEDTFSGS